MLLLTGTSDIIRVVTSSGGAAIKCHVSVVDNNAGTMTPERTNTASITSATTTTIQAAPSSSHQKSVRHINIRNDHASAADTVSVEHYDGTTATPLFKTTLAAGEAIVLGENGVWVYYDAKGKPYMGLGPLAVQADMEAATSTTTVVTPNAVKWHPGVNKFWGLFTIAGATTVGYNVDAPTDNGTGDITVNITTDFSSANWCGSVTIEMTATTYAVANARTAHIRFGGQAAGTLRCDCIDGTATTQLVKDPTVWHIAGWGDQ